MKLAYKVCPKCQIKILPKKGNLCPSCGDPLGELSHEEEKKILIEKAKAEKISLQIDAMQAKQEMLGRRIIPTGIACPKCETPLMTSSHDSNSCLWGLIPNLIFALMGEMAREYHCPNCGPVKFKELPEKDRSKMRIEQGVLIAVPGVIIVVLLVVIGTCTNQW